MDRLRKAIYSGAIAHSCRHVMSRAINQLTVCQYPIFTHTLLSLTACAHHKFHSHNISISLLPWHLGLLLA